MNTDKSYHDANRRGRRPNGCKVALTLVGMLVAASAGVAAWPADATESLRPFELAPTGCSMAHCDVTMSDIVGKPIPAGDDMEVLWRRDSLASEKAGSGGGIGCASNGAIAACSFRGPQDNVVAYDFDGNRLWTSGELLDWTTRAFVPMIATNGDVIAADQYRIIRFDPRGEVRWMSDTPGGTPISSVITESGTIVMATNRGPLSAYDSATGERIATLTVTLSDNDPGSFETVNTPSVRGNRVYVTLRYQIDGETDPGNLNRLTAIDIDATNPDPEARMQVAWFYEFIGPSSASPLLIGDTLFFDGDNDLPRRQPAPRVYAVQDLGSAPLELWQREFDQYIVASAARDPRGGLWVFPSGKRFGTIMDFLGRLKTDIEGTGNLIRLDQQSGVILDAFRIDDLLIGVDPELHFRATSAMTIAEDLNGDPVMLLNVTAYPINQLVLWPLQTFIIAVDLETLSLLWQVELPTPSGVTFGAQFPILERDGERRIVFSTEFGGTWAIGSASHPR